MIGNDIVDLNLSLSQSTRRRKGYLQKIFTPAEQEQINCTASPDQLVWLFWAMKEASYKAHQRKFLLPRSYNPMDFSCKILEIKGSSASGLVKTGNVQYYTSTSVNIDFLHCVSSAEINQRYLIKIEDISAEIKNLLISDFAFLQDLREQEITITKDQNGIPHFTSEKTKISADFSLSHHGKLAAYALALMNY